MFLHIVTVFYVYGKIIIHFVFLSSLCFLNSEVFFHCLFGDFYGTNQNLLDNNKTVRLGVDVVVSAELNI